jgi:hypothetical protein
MDWITRGIGANGARQPASLEGEQIRRILICRPNHRLGNMLMITPLVQDIAHYFPEATVDLFVQGEAALPIFRNYPQVSRFIQLPGRPFSHLLQYIGGWISMRFGRKYDLVINAYGGSSSGRLSTRFARAKHRVFIEDRKTAGIPADEDDRHMAKYPVEQFRLQMIKAGISPPAGPVPFMDLLLDEHAIAVRIESVARGHCMMISVEHSLLAGEGANQHQQRGLWQMEISEQAIDHGKVIASGTLGELRSLLGERDLLRLSGSFPPAAARGAVEGIDHIEVIQADESLLILSVADAARKLPALFAALAAAGADVRGATLTQPSLESLFIKLTGKDLRE